MVPGYPLRARSNSWIILPTLLIRKLIQIKHTIIKIEVVRSHHEYFCTAKTPVACWWRRSRSRQGKCSASCTTITFNITVLLHTADEDSNSSAENIFRGKQCLFSLNDLLQSFCVFCYFIILHVYDWLYIATAWTHEMKLKLRLESCKSPQGEHLNA